MVLARDILDAFKGVLSISPSTTSPILTTCPPSYLETVKLFFFSLDDHLFNAKAIGGDEGGVEHFKEVMDTATTKLGGFDAVSKLIARILVPVFNMAISDSSDAENAMKAVRSLFAFCHAAGFPAIFVQILVHPSIVSLLLATLVLKTKVDNTSMSVRIEIARLLHITDLKISTIIDRSVLLMSSAKKPSELATAFTNAVKGLLTTGDYIIEESLILLVVRVYKRMSKKSKLAAKALINCIPNTTLQELIFANIHTKDVYSKIRSTLLQIQNDRYFKLDNTFVMFTCVGLYAICRSLESEVGEVDFIDMGAGQMSFLVGTDGDNGSGDEVEPRFGYEDLSVLSLSRANSSVNIGISANSCPDFYARISNVDDDVGADDNKAGDCEIVIYISESEFDNFVRLLSTKPLKGCQDSSLNVFDFGTRYLHGSGTGSGGTEEVKYVTPSREGKGKGGGGRDHVKKTPPPPPPLSPLLVKKDQEKKYDDDDVDDDNAGVNDDETGAGKTTNQTQPQSRSKGGSDSGRGSGSGRKRNASEMTSADVPSIMSLQQQIMLQQQVQALQAQVKQQTTALSLSTGNGSSNKVAQKAQQLMKKAKVGSSSSFASTSTATSTQTQPIEQKLFYNEQDGHSVEHGHYQSPNRVKQLQAQVQPQPQPQVQIKNQAQNQVNEVQEVQNQNPLPVHLSLNSLKVLQNTYTNLPVIIPQTTSDVLTSTSHKLDSSYANVTDKYVKAYVALRELDVSITAHRANVALLIHCGIPDSSISVSAVQVKCALNELEIGKGRWDGRGEGMEREMVLKLTWFRGNEDQNV